MHEALYQQGLAQIEANEFTTAIQLFDQVLQISPDFSEAHHQRGLAYFKLNQFAAAIADYTAALTANPSPSLYYARALAHLSSGPIETGSLESAVADAKAAIRLKPDFAAAYHLLGTVRQQQSNADPSLTEKAIVSYKKAAELYLDVQDVANCRRCLERIRQLRPASSNLPAAQPATSEPVRPLPPPISHAEFLKRAVYKAQASSGSEALNGALADLDWAIQIDPQDVLAYVYRAQVRTAMDDFWGAIADYQQAAQLYLERSDQSMAKQMLEQIDRLKAQQKLAQAQANRQAARARYYSPESRSPRGKVSPAVQQKLLRLVGDDRRIAAGLVERLRLKHPGMPEDWYWEKAIYDLERDRR
jgi:tetratricopeptide (TPR) repeat protein